MEPPVRPFRVEIEESAIADARARLAATRWPRAEPVADWSQGTPSAEDDREVGVGEVGEIQIRPPSRR